MTKKAVQLSICMLLVASSVISSVSTAKAEVSSTEWWIQMEIFSKQGGKAPQDEILLKLHEDFLSNERQNIVTWHFFREADDLIRFRIEAIDRVNRDRIAGSLKDFVASMQTIKEYYFANHSQRIENLDQGYSGEQISYSRLWPYQKRIWEFGSEMAIESIKEFKETQANNPHLDYQLDRIFHLVSNQILPGYEGIFIEKYAAEQEKMNAVIFTILGVALGGSAVIIISRWRKRKQS